MAVIVIAVVAVAVMFSERLGLPIDLGAAGFRAGDMSNWGLIVAVGAGLWLVAGPGSGKASKSGSA